MRLAYPRPSGRNLLAGGLVLLLVAGAAAWRLVPRDEVTPAAAEPLRAGVFAYDTTGFEEVDILGGARHEYPRRTTIVVRRAGCGLVLRWQPFEERLQEWELCDGLRLRRITERHEFFGNDDRRTYRCDASSRFDGAYRCSTGETTEVARVVSSEGRRARLATRLSGGSTGSGTRELWLRPDGVPLRLAVENENTTPSLVGPVHYRERYELTLAEPSQG
jgi:hypothetical protein